MSGDVVKLTRAELYEQVWTTPMRKLAPQYGLSDVGLAKICKRLGIPRPPVGYWAKKEVGKAPARPRLPQADEHGDDPVQFFTPSDREEPCEYAFYDASLAIAHENELGRSTPEIPNTVRPQYRIAHESKRWFLEEEKWKARRRKARGAMHWPAGPGRPAGALRLDVSRGILDRVVRLIAGLEKAAKDRGHRYIVCENDPRSLEIEAFEARFYVRIREKLKQVKHELTDDERRQIQRYGRALFAPKWDLKPRGELELFYGRSVNCWRRHSWRDAARTKVEDRLQDFFVWMILDADAQRAEQARREEERRREAELQARREKLEAEQAAERRRVEWLLAAANAFHQSAILRTYVDAVRSNGAVDGGRFGSQEELNAWIEWALNQSDRIDPLVRSPPSVLDQDPDDLWDEPCE